MKFDVSRIRGSLAFRTRAALQPAVRVLSESGWSPTEASRRLVRRQLTQREPIASGRCLFICIFRAHNSETVERLISQAAELRCSFRLWDLDDAAPTSLRPWIFGSGPGGRSELLNRLTTDVTGFAWLIVSDDDVELGTDSLTEALHLCDIAQLDLAQPAHTGRSHTSYQISRVRALSLVRLTRFVEVGPLFIASARTIPEIFPLDESDRMGWGLDMKWSTLTDRGFRLAVIDGSLMTHLNPPAQSYSVDGSMLDAAIQASGGMERIMSTLQTWRPWRRIPPWLDQDRPSRA